MILSNVASIYENPDRVVSGIPGVKMIINGYASKIDKWQLYGNSYYYANMKYRIELEFKDGRMRVNLPEITDMQQELDYDITHHNGDSERTVFFMLNPGAKTNANKLLMVLMNYIVYGIEDQKSKDEW